MREQKINCSESTSSIECQRLALSDELIEQVRILSFDKKKEYLALLNEALPDV